MQRLGLALMGMVCAWLVVSPIADAAFYALHGGLPVLAGEAPR